MNSAKVFEEEDFDPRDYGYVLTPDILNTKACFILKEAEDDLAKKTKSNPDATEVIVMSHVNNIVEFIHKWFYFQLQQGIQGIIHRLRLLRLYLQALSSLTPSKSATPNEQEMNEITRLLNNAVDLMPLIKRTISLGTQPDPNGNDDTHLNKYFIH